MKAKGTALPGWRLRGWVRGGQKVECCAPVVARETRALPGPPLTRSVWLLMATAPLVFIFNF